MLKKLFNFILSRKQNDVLLKLVIVLCILFIYYFWKNKHLKLEEGFVQNERYILKTEDKIYDSFYVQIYDYLNKTKKRSSFELQKIIEATQPDVEYSIFLDIGCGTGCLVDQLRKAGYQAAGMDKSKAMIEYSASHYPEINIKYGEAEDAMNFQKNTFSHILCMNFTIYEIRDKIAFFRNCHHWLQPGGYFLLHLVDPQSFDPIHPAGKSWKTAEERNKQELLIGSPSQKSDTRITDTVIDFVDFKYKTAYDFDKIEETDIVVKKETFTDKVTNNIRENEQTLYMEKIEDIEDKLRFCGFVQYARFDLNEYNGDSNQYIYVLQRVG